MSIFDEGCGTAKHDDGSHWCGTHNRSAWECYNVVARREYEELKRKLEDADTRVREMGEHAARLRVCLLRYGAHSAGCTIAEKAECDCGLSANIDAIPGEQVSRPNAPQKPDHGPDAHGRGRGCFSGLGMP